MTGRQVVDHVGALLAADEPVPDHLVADLVAALPEPERVRWLRMLVELAWRPAGLGERT